MPASQQHVFAAVLGLIPSHRDRAQPPADLATALAQHSGLSAEFATGAVSVALDMLDAVGALKHSDDGVRYAGQLPGYFARSLAWLSRHGIPVFDGWRGDARQSAVRVLAALERQRVDHAAALGVPAEPIRDQHAAIVLIENNVDGGRCYLHQFDARAQQYQLIGGRIEPDETPARAAEREVIEEVGPAQPRALTFGHEFTLAPIHAGEPVLQIEEVSATYGALTHYTFFGFRAMFAATPLLGPHDRWVSLEDMRIGRTRDGHRLGIPRLIAELEKLGAFAN
jgi:8-oxo-dGTP pyrophosphatase MutT (NUDIX family)